MEQDPAGPGRVRGGRGCRPCCPSTAPCQRPRLYQRAMFVHTRWIEAAFKTEIPPEASAPADEAAARERMVVEVGGRRLEVVVPAALTMAVRRGGHVPRPNGAAAGPGTKCGADRRRGRPVQPHAGHHREDRRFGGAGRLSCRPDHRARGDENRTARDRAQGRDRDGRVRRSGPDRHDRGVICRIEDPTRTEAESRESLVTRDRRETSVRGRVPATAREPRMGRHEPTDAGWRGRTVPRTWS